MKLGRVLVGTSLVALAAVAAQAQSSTETYSYDALGRLISVVTTGGQNNAETHSICYDDAGNRTQYVSDSSGAPAPCAGGPPPPANLAIGNASVTEGGTLSFTVTRSGNTAIAASASYATANGTAIAPGDYTTKTGTVSFAAGETSKTITVTTIDDTAVEASETLSVTLSGPSANTTITTATATGTINDNDVAPANLAIGNASVTEGGTLSFTVTRSGNTAIAASASYATANGTAIAPGDYTTKTGTVSFAAGETSKTITVTTIDDTAVEASETLSVTLSGPSANTTITTATATGTINDNDVAPANLAIGNASVTEGGTLSFTVTRSGNTAIAASASYATVNGTAIAPGDYTTKTGTVSFAAGETSKTITVTTIDDTAVEASETLSVTLSGPSANTAITTATATGTINDNDVAPPSGPSFAISDASGLEGGVLVFTVTKTGATSESFTVNFATANNNATTLDYTATSGTLTFTSTQTTRTISVTTKVDLKVEGDETFFVNLSGQSGSATISDPQGLGTIFNDDSNCSIC